MLVVSDYGARQLLSWGVQDVTPPDPMGKVALFTADFTPSRTSDLGDFTLAAFSGSTPQDIDRADWSSVTTIDGKATSTAPAAPLSFTNGSSSVTVYGAVFLNYAEDEWIFAERFGTPRVLATSDELTLVMKLTDRTDPG